jgi:hypothetical protein
MTFKTGCERTDEGTTITLNGVYNSKINRAIFLDASDIKLIDFKNRKEYLVIRDDQNQCICSTNAGTFQVAEGTSVGFWAKFAAPPEAVTALSLVWTTAEPVVIPIAK